MKPRKPSQINKLDWSEFNFLENLLVFCIMPERDAPVETGLHFRISPRETDESLCLLFEIDRKGDSLFRNGEKQPDYMVFYASADSCICTIIEMKGGKDLKGSIKQIRNLYNRLRTELNQHLPSKFIVKFQALVLHAPVSQTPNKLFTEISTREFLIRPLQCPTKAELFDFISKIFTFSDPDNKIENIRNSREDSFIEETLINYALPKRKIDGLCKKNKHIANNRDGVYINHQLSQKNYSALAVDTSEMIIGVRKLRDESTERIKRDLGNLGLVENTHYKIEKTD